MPGQRKSIEPMAARLGVDPQRLQQFVTDSPWDEEQVWRVVRQEVIPHFEPIEAWIVDETGWLKQGKDSVGVSHQYCGAVGKQGNCQVSVELVVSSGCVAAPIGGRLYLPQSWAEKPERRAADGKHDQRKRVRDNRRTERDGDWLKPSFAQPNDNRSCEKCMRGEQ